MYYNSTLNSRIAQHRCLILLLAATFLILSSLVMPAQAAAIIVNSQSSPFQLCAPSSPTAIYNPDSSVTIDLGTCFIFQGASAGFSFNYSTAAFFGDLFRVPPITLTLDYSSPDSYQGSFTIYVCDLQCTRQLSPAITLQALPGSQSVTLPMTFQPGMYLHIEGNFQINDSNAQCFAFGYYCYYQARFTMR